MCTLNVIRIFWYIHIKLHVTCKSHVTLYITALQLDAQLHAYRGPRWTRYAFGTLALALFAAGVLAPGWLVPRLRFTVDPGIACHV